MGRSRHPQMDDIRRTAQARRISVPSAASSCDTHRLTMGQSYALTQGQALGHSSPIGRKPCRCGRKKRLKGSEAGPMRSVKSIADLRVQRTDAQAQLTAAQDQVEAAAERALEASAEADAAELRQAEAARQGRDEGPGSERRGAGNAHLMPQSAGHGQRGRREAPGSGLGGTSRAGTRPSA